jgi:hypothetical protein
MPSTFSASALIFFRRSDLGRRRSDGTADAIAEEDTERPSVDGRHSAEPFTEPFMALDDGLSSGNGIGLAVAVLMSGGTSPGILAGLMRPS